MAEKDDLVRLVQEMIRIQSPPGGEGRLAGLLKERMEGLGFDEVWTDPYNSAVGVVRGGPGPTILLDGHIDTVPVPEPEKWSHDPFGGEVAGGRLYGRGTSDMKGAVGAMIMAAADLIPDQGRLKGSLVISASGWEERYEGHALEKITEDLRPKGLYPDLVIIGEASELKLKIAQRGRAEIVFRTFGRPAHASTPHLGVNAVYKMVPVIEAVRALKPKVDPVLGPGIFELTDILSDPFPGASVVPSACRVTVDRRLLPGETEEAVLAPLQEILDRLAKEDPDFRGRVEINVETLTRPDGRVDEIKQFPVAWRMDKDHPAVRMGVRALKAAGLSGELSHYSFCTNGSFSAGKAGIPTLGFGPSKETLAHTIDEYVELQQLHLARAGYRSLMATYLELG